MNEQELKVPFSDPLNQADTEGQTFGCRANNPNICANAYMQGVCAFSSNDGICKKPSRAWKKQYLKLKEEQENG